ncbi:hypothetical protein M011DRAFT_265219 [Sporormia fimetaria CBS 119925]|uniref:Uncharacterized protein n=1 Tax=Sporormia fimetaria CBS 119925 TaxID=1340428 RepID=A0A6A6UYF0_9PLEO|nr:hypothetical protein M011DRAFT_265219 [Sporormia fimetaria CBS 119925]
MAGTGCDNVAIYDNEEPSNESSKESKRKQSPREALSSHKSTPVRSLLYQASAFLPLRAAPLHVLGAALLIFVALMQRVYWSVGLPTNERNGDSSVGGNTASFETNIQGLRDLQWGVFDAYRLYWRLR